MAIFKGYKVLLEDGYHIANFEISDGVFSNINKDTKQETEDIIIPGFFDIHTHGANGYDFTTVKNLEEIKNILDFYMSKGVTSVFPTLLTESDETIYKQMDLIYEASKIYPVIKGIHLEGPFLSKKYKGAQLEKYLQLPTISKCDEFINKSHGLFKYMTVAPELEGFPEVIKYLTSKGIVVSMGHSDASFDETRDGFYNGAKCITHCMNAMKGLHQHYPSICEAAFYFDDLYNEVIVDGAHIHPEMVEFIYKIKKEDHFITVTDSLMCAGLPDGEYKIGVTPIIVKGPNAFIKDSEVRAGSTLNMHDAFLNFKKFTGCNDLIASKVTSLNASKMLNMDNLIGSIKENKYADFIIMDKNYKIKEVYIKGVKVI